MRKFLKNLLTKPEPPIRMSIIRRADISEYNGMTLSEIAKLLPADATLDIDYYDTEIIYTSEETDEEFSIRQKKYEIELERYSKWYEKNKDNITYTLQLRKEIDIKNKELKRQNLETKQKKLLAEIKELEREIEDIEKW